jgi:hypothetical protein
VNTCDLKLLYIYRKQEIPAGVILLQSAIASELTRKIHPYIFMQSNKQLLFTFSHRYNIYKASKFNSYILCKCFNSINQSACAWLNAIGWCSAKCQMHLSNMAHINIKACFHQEVFFQVDKVSSSVSVSCSEYN